MKTARLLCRKNADFNDVEAVLDYEMGPLAPMDAPFARISYTYAGKKRRIWLSEAERQPGFRQAAGSRRPGSLLPQESVTIPEPTTRALEDSLAEGESGTAKEQELSLCLFLRTKP